MRLRGPANVTVPEDLEAFVDLTGKRAGQYRVTPQISLPARFSLLAVKPENVHVRLEPEITRTLPVVTAVIGLPPGTEVVIGRPEPTEVRDLGVRKAESNGWPRSMPSPTIMPSEIPQWLKSRS